MKKLFRKITLRKYADCLDEKTYKDLLSVRGFMILYKNHTWAFVNDIYDVKQILETECDKVDCIFTDLDRINLSTEVIIDTSKIEGIE